MKIPLSVVIPAYNEEERIKSTCLAFLLSKAIDLKELIVVDDGSNDKTLEILNDLKEKYENFKVVKNERNEGKGFALKNGVLNSRDDIPYLLISDADLSAQVEEVKRFFPFLNNYAIIIGSRGLDRSYIKKHQPFYRELMGIFFNFLVQLFFLPGIYDTQCGFKLFKKNVAKEIFKEIKLKGFSYDVEVLILAKIKGYRIKEVPVIWEHMGKSKVKISKAPFLMLLELIFLYQSYHSQLKALKPSSHGGKLLRQKVF